MIKITVRASNANNALLMLTLYELLEHPDRVKCNLSNVAQPDNFIWLQDEINAFEDIMMELDRENQGGVYGDDDEKAEAGIQQGADG